MRHGLRIRIILILFAAGGTLRAATEPHTGAASVKADYAWTDATLNRVGKIPDLISVVGLPPNEASKAVTAPAPQSRAQDPAWYAARAASLNARLEAEQTDLRAFTQALDGVRDLKRTTGGVNLAKDDTGITPEAAIEILQTAFVKPQENSTCWKTLREKTTFRPELCAASGRALREAVRARPSNFNALSQAIHGGSSD